MMKNIIAIIITLLIIAYQIKPASNFDYDIILPSNWVAIPPDVLEYYVSEVSKKTGNQEEYDYAYQLSESKDWFKFPYILVQIKKGEKIPYSNIKSLKNYIPNNQGYVHSSVLEETDKDPFMIIYDSLYESDSKVIWHIEYLNMIEVGQLKQLTGIKLTEFGYIQFTYVSSEKDFDKYDEEFREIIRSIQLNDKDIYQIE